MSADSKTFFITGGAGFIGSNLVEPILKSGARVVVYDNLSSGRYDFVRKYTANRRFGFIEADILDKARLKKEMMKASPDVLVHLASNADVRLGLRITDLDLKQGTIGTYNALEAARMSGVKSIMFSSSSVVYGNASIKPTPEDYGPLKPISLYGASKLASEALITSFSDLFGFDYYIYRFANVVGLNCTHGVIVDFINKLRKNGRELEVLGDGNQRKSYVDVRDCSNAMLHTYKKGCRNEIVNIATDDQISVREIAKMVVSRISPGAKIMYKGSAQGWPGDIPDARLSNKKLKSLGAKLRYGKSRDVVSHAISLLA